MLAPPRAALVLALFALTASCGGGDTSSNTGGSAGSSGSAGAAGSVSGGAAGTSATAGSSGSAGAQGGTAAGGTSTGGTSTGGTGGTATGGTGTGATGGTGGTATGGTGAGATGGSGGSGGSGMFAGYGTLSGMCGDIDQQDVLSPDPSLFGDALDFTGRPAFDISFLSPGGQAMYAAGNLNQSSLYSEIFAYEVLYRCEEAAFLKGEADIVYAINGKKTDLLIELEGQKLGVSVVRAMSFPKGTPYPVTQAFDVLDGKLADILQSSANVAPEDAWVKQILAVMAQTPEHAAAIEEAYTMVDPATKADTIVLVTVTEGDDDFVYYNNNP
jgi:hypothetical protein